jgi:hypothetical protein
LCSPKKVGLEIHKKDTLRQLLEKDFGLVSRHQS